MLALAGCGQQAAALDLFANLGTRLADELGVEPGWEIRHAHCRILNQDLGGAFVRSAADGDRRRAAGSPAGR